MVNKLLLSLAVVGLLAGCDDSVPFKDTVITDVQYQPETTFGDQSWSYIALCPNGISVSGKSDSMKKVGMIMKLYCPERDSSPAKVKEVLRND